MTRLYENRPFARRMNISSAVVAFAVLFGFWELWSALNPGPEGAGYGFLFAALFIGGGIYGMNQLLSDGRDTVVSLDADEGGAAVIAAWSPFMPKRIAGAFDQLREWRPYGKTTRGVRTPVLLADHPGYPRPLQFEIGSGVMMTDRFRTLAGEALTALEKSNATQH